MVAPRAGGQVAVARFATRVPKLLLGTAVYALLGAFFVWPIWKMLLRSLNSDGSATLSAGQLTLDHFAEVFSRDDLRHMVVNTVVIALWATLFTALLAYPTAYVLSRLRGTTARVGAALIVAPLAISVVIRLFSLTQFLGKQGLVNYAAAKVGQGPFDLLFTRFSTVLGMVHYLLPFLIIVLYTNMTSIDRSFIEAAKNLGSSGAQAFRRVYFPMTAPALWGGTMMVFILGLSFYLTPAVLGGPGDVTMAVYIQQQIELLNWGSAAAVGVLLMLATMLLVALMMKLSGSSKLLNVSMSTNKGAARADRFELTPVNVLLSLFALGVVIFLLAPLALIVPQSFTTTTYLKFPPEGFTFHWYGQFFSSEVWVASTLKSLRVALLTALFTAVAAMYLVRVMLGLRSRVGRAAIQTMVFGPIIVPVIVLSIGMYDVQARLGLLDTTIGLALLHTVYVLPLAYVVVLSAFSGINKNLELAASTLGAGELKRFTSIVMRLAVPGLVGAAVIGFLVSWDEVVISLFQVGATKTLPVQIMASLESSISPVLAAIGTMTTVAVLLVVFGSALLSSRDERARRRARTRR